MKSIIRCQRCGSKFIPGKRQDDIPDGVTMVTKDNKSVTLCAECIMEIGKATEEKRHKILEQLGVLNQ